MLVTINDFMVGGKYELHTGNYDTDRLQDYIDKYEKRYLTELLGATLFEEFEADLVLGGGLPTEPRFEVIFEPLSVDYNWTIIYSEGMIEMLKGFIYYEYIKDQISQMTPIGMVTPAGQNSRESNSLYLQIYTRYNEAARTYKAIQRYILNNSNEYDFRGVRKMMITWL
jgi:hypothetical protein